MGEDELAEIEIHCANCNGLIIICGHGWTHVGGGHECAVQPARRVATPRNPVMINR